MKKGWEIKRLGEVCDLQNGFAFKSTDYIEFSNTVNFRMSQIRPGGGVDLENNPKYLPDEYAITYKDYLLKKGDIVIAMTDMATETKILGVPTIVPSDSRNWLLNQRVGKLFNIDKTKVNIAYLKYILVSEPINDYYKKLGRGGLQINIGKQDILNAKIPLPPLPEQQRIVSILDEAFAAIAKAKANAEQNLKNAKVLFESQLQLTMDNGKLKIGDGWEEKKLGEVIEYDKNQNIHKGLPYVGLEHIESNSGRFIGSLEPQVVKSSTFYFNEQHVLYGRLRPYLNKVLLPEFEGHCSTEIFPIKVGKQIAKEFLFYWLIAGSTVKKIDATWTGARMPRANMNQVLEFDFAFPPLKEQQTIVRQLDALRAETQKLEAVYQKKIADLEELKKSILQKAFNGELIEPAGELKTEKVLAI